ncbi:MAG: hypothetical protein DRO89_06180, partial [Candidatus Altiarchaeales archaeon]
MELHPNEIKILKVLKKRSRVDEIAEKAQLDLDAVNRTLSWLSTKGLVKIEERVIEEVSLGKEGKIYVEEGLPERRIIKIIGEHGDFQQLTGKLSDEEIAIGLGWLKRKKLGVLSRGKIEILKKEKTGDEKLLELLKKKGKIEVADLTPELKEGLQLLKGRKDVVKISERRRLWAIPTEKGLKAGKIA